MELDGLTRRATIVTFPEALVEVTDIRELDGGILLIGRTATGERLEVTLSPR